MQENLLSSQETVLFKQIGQSNGSETSNELNRLRNENAALKARIREREKQLVALESVVEGTLTGFWNWDLPANYQYHSPTFLNMFGYEAGELRPTPESWKNLIYPEDLPAVLATVDQVLKTGEPSAREVRYLHKNGNILWVYCRLQVVEWDEKHQPRRIVGSQVDITSLKETQLLMENFFNLSVDLFAVGDGSGRFCKLNPIWGRILGYSLEEMYEIPYLELVHPQDRAKTERMIEQLLAGHPISNLVARFRTKTGDYRWLSISGSAGITNQKFFAVARDITLEQQIQMALVVSEEGYRTIFDFAPIGIAQLNRDGVIRNANQSLERLLGFDYCELDHYNFASLAHRDDYARIEAAFEQVIEKEIKVYHGEHRFTHKDGFLVWGNITISLIPNPSGQPATVIVMLEDISPRKVSEFALRQKTDQLVQSNEELEQFAYIASHDLQEPLRTITTFMQLFRKEFHEDMSDKAEKYLHFVVDAGTRMKALLDSLLTFSRVGRDSSSMQAVDCEVVLGNVAKNLQFSIQDSGTNLRIGSLPTVYGNEIQLSQLFQNLISNGIKFRGESSPVIEVFAEKDPEGWTIHIRDNGIGISPEYHEKIFHVFQRLHHHDKYPGTGIGLAICKKIVDLHQGKLSVSSVPAMGTTFIIHLPDFRSFKSDEAE